MNEMPWTGRDGYLAAPTEDWVVDGHVAGTIKTFGDLTVSTREDEAATGMQADKPAAAEGVRRRAPRPHRQAQGALSRLGWV